MTSTPKATKKPTASHAKGIVTKALKGLSLPERVRVMASALRSMGLPSFAVMLEEALTEAERT